MLCGNTPRFHWYMMRRVTIGTTPLGLCKNAAKCDNYTTVPFFARCTFIASISSTPMCEEHGCDFMCTSGSSGRCINPHRTAVLESRMIWLACDDVWATNGAIHQHTGHPHHGCACSSTRAARGGVETSQSVHLATSACVRHQMANTPRKPDRLQPLQHVHGSDKVRCAEALEKHGDELNITALALKLHTDLSRHTPSHLQ